MTRYAPQWLDSPAAYSSLADRALLRSLFPSIGVRGMAPSVVANTMQLTFGAGAAAVPLNAQETVHLATDGTGENLTLDTAPASGQSRIDLVVARYRASTQDWIWAAIDGAATTGTPVAPSPFAGTDAPICSVLVTGGSAYITAANVTDLRSPLYAASPPIPPGFTFAGTPWVGTVPSPAPPLIVQSGTFSKAAGSSTFSIPFAQPFPHALFYAAAVAVSASNVWNVNYNAVALNALTAVFSENGTVNTSAGNGLYYAVGC